MELSVIPHSRDSEQALIGAVMTNPEALFDIRLRPSDFYDHINRWWWEAIVSVYNRKEPVDFVTVGDEIRKQGRSDKDTGGPGYLLDCVNNTPSSLHAKVYADKVRDASIRREIINSANGTATDAFDFSKPVNEIIATRSNELNDLSTVENEGKQLVRMVSDTIDIVAQRINQRARGETVEIGYKTGIGYIDRNFLGWKKGWLIYWAGSANVGKSQAAMQISKVLVRQDPGDYIALEGSEESTVYRMLEGMLRVDAVDIEFGNVDATDLYQTLEEFEGMDYNFSYLPRLSVYDLRSYIAKQKLERNIGWAIIDYVSLLMVDGKDRNEKDENMSHELRRIASEFNILLIGLDSIVKSGATGILSMEDIAGRYSKQHDSDITLGYSDYKPIKGIAPDLNDYDRERNCRLLGVLKDRHRKCKGMTFPLEMKDGLINDLIEEDNYTGHYMDDR